MNVGSIHIEMFIMVIINNHTSRYDLGRPGDTIFQTLHEATRSRAETPSVHPDGGFEEDLRKHPGDMPRPTKRLAGGGSV